MAARLSKVAAKQQLSRDRGLIIAPIGCPNRFVDVLARQERSGGLRFTFRKSFRASHSRSSIACKHGILHLLRSFPRAAPKRIENSVPVVFPIEGCHIEQ
jgi:hypothetical protein